jgi:hypothetical protein
MGVGDHDVPPYVFFPEEYVASQWAHPGFTCLFAHLFLALHSYARNHSTRFSMFSGTLKKVL